MDVKKSKWTVGFVNFRSSIYMEHQLKILYEFNDSDEFNLIIVDNTNNKSEYENLLKICEPYIKSKQNLRLINNIIDVDAIKKTYGERFFVSGHHASGIKVIYDIAKNSSDYLLIQDPDFFYVKNNYLKTFEDLHKKGNIAVGAPYPKGVAWGDPLYPEAYGCSYIISYLNDNSFTPGFADEEEMKVYQKEYNNKYVWWGFDVGWRIRKDYSDRPFISFKQRKSKELIKIVGQQFITKPYEYKLKGDIIGYHLNGGTRHPKEISRYLEKYDSKELDKIFQDWQDIRKKYAEYFYDAIKNKKKSRLMEKIIRVLS